MSLTSQSSTEYNFQLKDCFLGGQMLFVAFGALVLVPLLTGLNPNVALFTAGLGTTILASILGKDYLKDPGIENTMLGDGIAISLASFLGGPPNTTYSEVTGAVALTKIYNPAIMTWAAITVMLLAFIGKLGSILQTIPVTVMGGIMLLLFGAIMVVGLNTLNRSKQSYD